MRLPTFMNKILSRTGVVCLYARRAPKGHGGEKNLRGDASFCLRPLRRAFRYFLHRPGSRRCRAVLLPELLRSCRATAAATHHHRKGQVRRSVATLGRASRFYDVTTSKEYEVESAPLTSDECLQVEQLFTSPTVRIPFGIYSVLYETDFDALATILIADFTSEISDTDEKPN